MRNARLDKSTPKIFNPMTIERINKTIFEIRFILLTVFELNTVNLLIPFSTRSIIMPVKEKKIVIKKIQ